jgi:hypothetical protein
MKGLLSKLLPYPCIIALLFSLLLAACKKESNAPRAIFKFQKVCLSTDSCKVTFINESVNADIAKWDFGDGTTSTDANPVHTYPQNRDSFIVKLKVSSLSAADDDVAEAVIHIVEAPVCENIGSFKCAGKLESGVAIKSKFDAAHGNSYFYFTTPKPGVAKIIFSPVPSGTSFQISVLSEAKDDSPILKADYGKAGETVILYAGALAKDTFFVKLDPPGNSGNEFYTLTYVFNNDDPNEINDKFSQATFLPFDVSMPGTILAQNDLDYFRFYQSKSSAVDITLSPVPLFPNNNELTMEVYNSANSDTKLTTKYGNPGETMKFSVGPLDSGSHYILLKSYYESPDKYFLQVSADESDPNEFNNTFSKATLLQNNVGVKATIKADKDEDYYKYVATANTPATITIDKVPAGLSYLSVEVFKEANDASRIEFKTPTEGSSLSFNTAQALVAGQTYYFHLYSYYNNQWSNEQYTIKVKQ